MLGVKQKRGAPAAALFALGTWPDPLKLWALVSGLE